MGNFGAYKGIRVVELTEGIAGPYATRFMADQGADVIKSETTVGDHYRSDPGFQVLNRNKRSVVLEDDSRLLQSADVIVVDSSSEADRARSIAPGSVIISMPTWGSSGPLADQQGSWEQVAAATGISWNQVSWTEGPVHVVLPLASYGAGMLGALAIAAGLYAREVHGSAPTYEVSELAGSGAMQIGDFWSPGTPEERDGASPLGPAGRAPVYRPFQAADDLWLFVACGTLRFYKGMLEALSRSDLLNNPSLENPPWGLIEPDPLAYVTPILEEAFRSRNRDEWIEKLRLHDVPCQPIQTRQEFLLSDLAKSNSVIETIEHPELGQLSMPTQPLQLGACPAAKILPAPALGADTDEVMQEQHVPGGGSGQGGSPLGGVRAVDLASFIAGPVITRHLAMLGADVIKVEPDSGDPFRTFSPMFNGWNQGKRGVVLDLKEEVGREFLYKMVATSDVVVENFRPGVAERLGCAPDDLRSVSDDLILVKSPGYGFDESRADQPAFDPLLQALGGMMSTQGGDGEPVFLTVPVHDAATPIIAAFGVVTAMYHRTRTGEAQTVYTSLAQTTAAAQAAEFVDYRGRPKVDQGGFDYKGPDEDHCYIEDSGNWFWSGPEGLTRVETKGFVGSELAAANDLICEHADSPGWGPLIQVGQLIRGAGPHPQRAPYFDEHADDLRAEFS